MTKHIVTIRRTITTEVEVDAVSAVAARRHVMNYGFQEAVSDFHVVNEEIEIIIVNRSHKRMAACPAKGESQ